MTTCELTKAQKQWNQGGRFIELLGELAVPIASVAIYSLVCLFIYGVRGNHYLLMLIWSILSVAGALSFVLATYYYGATGSRSVVAMLMAWAGFIPYGFGLYVTCYQGLWGFSELRTGFSIWLVAKSIGAIIVGYWIVKKMYAVTAANDRFCLWVKSDPSLTRPEDRQVQDHY